MLGHLKERCSSFENPTQLDTNTKIPKKVQIGEHVGNRLLKHLPAHVLGLFDNKVET